jgi:serine protease AprX
MSSGPLFSSISTLAPEALAEARKRVENELGSDLASKATDEFLLAVAASRAPAVAGLEAVAAPGPGPAAVIEFAPPPEEIQRLPELVEQTPTEGVTEAIRRAHAQAGLPEHALALQGDLPLRQAGIKATRDDFLRTAGPIHAELERTAAVLSPRAQLEALGAAALAPRRGAVEVCWLIRALRTVADPRALSEVVADPAVTRVDVPRRIEPDQDAIPDFVDVTMRDAAGVRQQTGATGHGVTVGVIDTEVALGHPVLGDRVIQKQNFTSEPFGTPAPHGTAVAGIIAGGPEIAGIAPGVTIYGYKVLATNRALHSDDFEGALAIQQALEDGVRVVNCSWRGPGPAGDGTSREARACNTAWGFGLTIVKSVGNGGPGPGTLTTPADADGVIVVGATDRAGTAVQDYSSRGPTASGAVRPHLVAPGGIFEEEGIVSALVGGGVGDVGSGTSFATPHVTGLVALLLEREPQLTPPQVRDRLIASCSPLAGVDENTQGAGLVGPLKLFGLGG